jgi:hypothetical protein
MIGLPEEMMIGLPEEMMIGLPEEKQDHCTDAAPVIASSEPSARSSAP